MVSKHSQEFYASVSRIGVFRLKNEKEGSFEMLVIAYDTIRYLIQYIGLTSTVEYYQISRSNTNLTLDNLS
jgi:hypothetical protein